jgi:hypothetical protein
VNEDDIEEALAAVQVYVGERGAKRVDASGAGSDREGPG